MIHNITSVMTSDSDLQSVSESTRVVVVIPLCYMSSSKVVHGSFANTPSQACIRRFAEVSVMPLSGSSRQ